MFWDAYLFQVVFGSMAIVFFIAWVFGLAMRLVVFFTMLVRLPIMLIINFIDVDAREQHATIHVGGLPGRRIDPTAPDYESPQPALWTTRQHRQG